MNPTDVSADNLSEWENELYIMIGISLPLFLAVNTWMPQVLILAGLGVSGYLLSVAVGAIKDWLNYNHLVSSPLCLHHQPYLLSFIRHFQNPIDIEAR